jgi:hypothetical protein
MWRGETCLACHGFTAAGTVFEASEKRSAAPDRSGERCILERPGTVSANRERNIAERLDGMPACSNG